MRSLVAILSAFVVLAVLGCGYKPVSVYAKKSLGQSVYASVITSRSDPENTVIIHDALLESLSTRFNVKLSKTAQEADSLLSVSIHNIEFAPAEYDKNGYVILYRVTVSLQGKLSKKEQAPKTLTAQGSYDFPIEPNTTISESKRFEAIKNSATKAIERLISQISLQGVIQ